jgi:ankyrin repeat protein
MDHVTAFCRALWRHEENVIARLAPRVDPNGADRWGHTPLLMAAEYGDLRLVELLVRRGAAVDQGRVHLTPITLAARRGAIDIVDFLRDHGATPSIVTWTYPAHQRRGQERRGRVLGRIGEGRDRRSAVGQWPMNIRQVIVN